jgi:ABC-2 type transport system ATP-binding protein
MAGRTNHRRGGSVVIEAVNLTKRYRDTSALEILNLRVAPGEIVALLGANGAGKTTTINLFLGFIAPTDGTAMIDGLNVAEHLLESKRRLAYIPEQVMLYPALSGLENLQYFSDLAGATTDISELERLLREAGLQDDAIHRPVSTYSKGMRQKVGIAIALAKRAKALFLDEPTSGLDPKAAYDFSESLKRLATEGTAVLMATHDLFHAKETATRIGIMKAGRLVETLSAEEIGHADLEALYLRHMHA